MKLSIITICFNSEHYIEDTILSVMNQTFTDYEFIIIDGSSTDSTLKIIEKYKEKIDVLVSEKDTGIYNAQNKGIKKASGEYLFFLNSGDYFFDNNTLEKIFENSNGESIVYGDIVNNWGQNKNIWNQKGLKFRAYPESIDLGYWKQDFLCHQVVFIKKELFSKYGNFDETYRYAADHDFFYRVWFKPEVTKLHIPIIVTIYDMSGVSIQEGNREKVLSEIKKSFEINFPEELKKKETIKQQIVKLLVFLKFENFLKIYNSIKLFFFEKKKDLEFIPFKNNSRKKVLIVNTFDKDGGAGIATFRIFKSILDSEYDVRYLSAYSKDSNKFITYPLRKTNVIEKLNKIFKVFKIKIYFKFFKTTNPLLHSVAYVSNFDIIKTIEKINPDIVHLNWVQFDLLTIEDLAKIKKPILWTVHDMWPICGAEHYTDSERYKDGYIPLNRPQYESGFDLNKWVWERKLKYLQGKKNLFFAGVSNWMTNCIKESNLFKNNQSFVVPNGLDAFVFKPQDKIHSRKIFNISQEKKIILFGALSFHSDERKGFKYIIEALNYIFKTNNVDDIEVLVFGSDAFEQDEKIPFKHSSLGRMDHPELLSKVYSSADVMIVPSMLESFGQTASEAMACGTPVVCFDTSGLKDIVDHKVNGYRAECFSSEDLANGILWVLEDEERRKKLSINAVKKVESEFTLKKLSENYINVYNKILKNSESD